jgi:hypothetical protein
LEVQERDDARLEKLQAKNLFAVGCVVVLSEMLRPPVGQGQAHLEKVSGHINVNEQSNMLRPPSGMTPGPWSFHVVGGKV